MPRGCVDLTRARSQAVCQAQTGLCCPALTRGRQATGSGMLRAAGVFSEKSGGVRLVLRLCWYRGLGRGLGGGRPHLPFKRNLMSMLLFQFCRWGDQGLGYSSHHASQDALLPGCMRRLHWGTWEAATCSRVMRRWLGCGAAAWGLSEHVCSPEAARQASSWHLSVSGMVQRHVGACHGNRSLRATGPL